MTDLLAFDPERIMDEWRRFYDWAVLSRQRLQIIEEIGTLGQKFSSLLSAYRHTLQPQRRSQLAAELQAIRDAMQVYYEQCSQRDRPALDLSGPPA